MKKHVLAYWGLEMFRRIIVCLALLGNVGLLFAEEGLGNPESSSGWSWVERKVLEYAESGSEHSSRLYKPKL